MKCDYTDVQKANARKRAEDTAWKRAQVFVILHPDKPGYGCIRVARPAEGRQNLMVFVHDFQGKEMQVGRCGNGYGFNRLNAALDGLTFDGISLDDCGEGWETRLVNAGYKVIQAL